MRIVVRVWIWSDGDVEEVMDSKRVVRSVMSSSLSIWSSVGGGDSEVVGVVVGSISIASASDMLY